MKRTSLVVIVYDVASDARRSRLHRLLKQYGLPIQLSAFEARLQRSERRRLVARATELLDPAADRFVMYLIHRHLEGDIQVIGRKRPEITDPGYYLV